MYSIDCVLGSNYVVLKSTTCQSHGMKMIESKEECEKASNFLGFHDVTAFVSQSQGEPYGCLYTDLVHVDSRLRWYPPTGSPYKSAPCGSRKGATFFDCICRIGNYFFEENL